MKKRLKNILTLPEYTDFCVRYRHDFLRYAIEVCSMTPTWQQAKLLKAASKPGCRVAVRSGHGTGKSRAYAVICDAMLRIYPFSNTLLTATSIDQVRSVVWKELEDLKVVIDQQFPWMAPYFIKEAKRYYAAGFKDSWFVIPRTASKSRPESIAGMHRKWYTVLVDEASGVDDAIMETLNGGLTIEENRLIMVSQQTRVVGHFADAFSRDGEKIYETMTFNAEEAPPYLVTKKWIKDQLILYGGHHSPQYQIRVLGRAPDNLAGYLIPRQWCEQAQGYEIEHAEPWGWVMTIDVGEGVYRDSSVINIAKVSGFDETRVAEPTYYEEHNNIDPKVFGRMAHNMAKDYPYITIAVDSDGPGLATALEMEDLGSNVVRIHWGRPCHAKKDRGRYQDQRAYACVMARHAVFEERMKLIPGGKIVEQASHIPFEFDGRGRYVIMPKKKMAAKGIKSPDLFDTHAFFWLCDYTPSDETRDEDIDAEYEEYLRAANEAIEGA